MTNFDSSEIVDAGGWDMVVGLPLSQINAALSAEAAKLDLSFSYNAPSSGQSFSIQGTFGPWSISGGSGQDLILTIPIATGTFTSSGEASGAFALPAGPLDLGGLSVSIDTRLEFQMGPSASQTSNMIFAFTDGISETSSSVGTPVAGTLSGGSNLPQLVQELLPYAVASCLAANLSKMDFVFATLTANMGGPAPGQAVQSEWQYVLANQQNGAGQTLAIFYSGSAQTSSTANVPGQIEVGGDDCVIVLSQQATLDTVLIPAIISGLDHVRNLGPATGGMGPLLLKAPPASNSVPSSTLIGTPGPDGSNTATISAPNPILLNYGTYFGYQGSTVVPETELLTLSEFSCAIAGTAATVTFSAAVSNVPNPYTVSQAYNIVVGTVNSFGQSYFGVTFASSGRPSVQGSNGDGNDAALSQGIPLSLTLGLVDSPLPFSITLFNNQTIEPQFGLLNGGLAMAGPIAAATAAATSQGVN
jgi:hypothetical protein